MEIKAGIVTINVSNMNASIAFYETIGMKLDQRWDNFFATLSATGITIGLHGSEKVDKEIGSGNLSIGITVDDIEKTKNDLIEAKIEYKLRDEEGGNFIHLNDPDGNSIYFVKPNW